MNLIAFSGFPAGRQPQLDFIPADAVAFKSVAKVNKWKVVGPKRGFLIQGDDDRVGAIAEIVGCWRREDQRDRDRGRLCRRPLRRALLGRAARR